MTDPAPRDKGELNQGRHNFNCSITFLPTHTSMQTHMHVHDPHKISPALTVLKYRVNIWDFYVLRIRIDSVLKFLAHFLLVELYFWDLCHISIPGTSCCPCWSEAGRRRSDRNIRKLNAYASTPKSGFQLHHLLSPYPSQPAPRDMNLSWRWLRTPQPVALFS